MTQSLITRLSISASLALAASGALAAPVAIDTANPINGLTSIFSVTFDGGALPPCGGGASTYCTWFGGDPTVARNVTSSPYPSKVLNVVPGGIGPTGVPVAPVPASGSFLDLTLSGGNTQLTLGVSSITFGTVDICIASSSSCATLLAHAVDAGIVFNPTGPANGGPFTPPGGGSTGDTVPVDVNGKAVFQVQNGGNIVVDFSKFSSVVTSCTGTQCALVQFDVLNLDVVRYVLEIDYDPTFTSFTGRFIGQTGNASIVYATLNSAGSDQDGDTLVDTADNCPSNANLDQADSDGDGRGNVCDNCSSLSNTAAGVVPNTPGLLRAQLDADADGYGNACDADLNNSGGTTASDYAVLRSRIGTLYNSAFNSAKADINGSGSVTAADYAILRSRIGTPPGPSGLACAGTTPCPAP